MKKEHRLFIGSILGVIVIFIFFQILVSLNGMKDIPYTDITENVEIDVRRANGKTDLDVPIDHLTAKRGDVVIYHVQLPQKIVYTNTMLCFHQADSVITAYYDGRLLYTNGRKLDQAGGQIGNVAAMVPFTKDMYGHQIVVYSESRERLSTSHRTEFYLMPMDYATRYPMIGHEAEFILFLGLMIAGFVMTVLSVIFWILRAAGPSGIWLGLFSLLSSVWYFGYNRLFYVLTPESHAAAISEYVALYIVPIPLLLSIRGALESGLFRKVTGWMAYILAGFTFISLALSASPIPINLDDTLIVLQATLILILTVLLIFVLLEQRYRENGTTVILIQGLTISMSFAVLEIIGIRLQSIGQLPALVLFLATLDYAAIGMLLIVVTLMSWSVLSFLYGFRTKLQQEELEMLAYKDLLSDIPNRTSCVEKLKELERNDRSYTVAFFDADGLKRLNDNYGHDMGDLLIKEVADCIRRVFANSRGFFGRWGGDEFVAVFYEDSSVAAFKAGFKTAINLKNAEGKIPGGLQVSMGTARHEKGVSETPTEVVNRADAAMYEVKQERKRKRKEEAVAQVLANTGA